MCRAQFHDEAMDGGARPGPGRLYLRVLPALLVAVIVFFSGVDPNSTKGVILIRSEWRPRPYVRRQLGEHRRVVIGVGDGLTELSDGDRHGRRVGGVTAS